MSLEIMRNHHMGAKIGILGSGPSLTRHLSDVKKFCDVVIACNGSLLALDPGIQPIDYFLYADQLSPTRNWFRSSLRFKNSFGGSVMRILPNSLLPFDDIVLPSQEDRREVLLQLKEYSKRVSGKDSYRTFVPEEFPTLSKGVSFSYIGDKVSSLESGISGSGTITGIGIQIAYLMGASRINLFGCGFNNSRGDNYAYDCKGQVGGIIERHVEHMNDIINQVKQKGVNVFSFGETNLDVDFTSSQSSLPVGLTWANLQ